MAQWGGSKQQQDCHRALCAVQDEPGLLGATAATEGEGLQLLNVFLILSELFGSRSHLLLQYY